MSFVGFLIIGPLCSHISLSRIFLGRRWIGVHSNLSPFMSLYSAGFLSHSSSLPTFGEDGFPVQKGKDEGVYFQMYFSLCCKVLMNEEGGDNGCDQLSGSTRVGENLPAAATAPEIWQNLSTFSPCSKHIQVQKRTDSPGTKSSAKSIGIYVVTTTAMSERHYFELRL